MKDIVRNKLAELIGRFGLDLCNDARRCEALLRDECGEHRREISALVAAAKDGVGSELRQSSAGVPKELIVARLTKRLHENVGLAEDLARWAVESWAVALGMASAKEFRFPFKCPKCGAAGSIATKLAGRKVTCPNCSANLFIADNGREVFLAPGAQSPSETAARATKKSVAAASVPVVRPLASPSGGLSSPLPAVSGEGQIKPDDAYAENGDMMLCPTCGRDNVRPVVFVYETRTTAPAVLGGLGNNPQSLFIKRLAPPKRYTPHPGLLLFPSRNIVCIGVLLLIAVIAIANRGLIGLVLALALIGICIWLLIHGYRTRGATRQRYYDLDRWYAQDYEVAQRRWQQSQVCLDCGHVFDSFPNVAPKSTRRGPADQQ